MSNFYVAYLLRLWTSEEAGKPAWRASLESPQTGNMLYFSSLPGLFRFIESGGKDPEGEDSRFADDGAGPNPSAGCRGDAAGK